MHRRGAKTYMRWEHQVPIKNLFKYLMLSFMGRKAMAVVMDKITSRSSKCDAMRSKDSQVS